jgi:hypothetical protein
MLHHHISKYDLENLASMSSNDLEQYYTDIMNRIRHLETMEYEARELAQAIRALISDHRLPEAAPRATDGTIE